MALLLAIEFDARIGSAAGGKFQQRGFHPTGVVGLFGAVMAATRLLGGTNDDAVRAQGIALSTASGSMAFLDDGSWTKRLHPGWAASSAITAAHLAMAGFEGPSDPYSGRFGLYALFAGDAACAEQLADVSDSPRQWALDEVAIKPYPVCHFNHAPVDAALALRKEYALSSHQIVSGQILLHEAQFGVVVDPIERKRAPTSEYEAKFSAPYAVAAALVKGKLGLQELEADTRADPEILALAQKLTCHHDGRSVYPKAFSGGLRLTLEDGRVLESFAEVNRGAEGRLLERDLVQEKFMQNCLLTTTADHATAIWQAVMALDQLSDCRDFIDLIAMPTVASQE
jgi:2-methylcitrate dehydratase PrpD